MSTVITAPAYTDTIVQTTLISPAYTDTIVITQPLISPAYTGITLTVQPKPKKRTFPWWLIIIGGIIIAGIASRLRRK